MVTMIPDDPDFGDSSAEAAVWAALATQLPDTATLIHGQRLTTDEKDIEIDFLLLWPGLGVAVIEVKGGRIDVVDGNWYTTDANRQRHHLRQSPVEQAMVAKHGLIRYLRTRLSRLPGPIIHFAVLPYTELASDWDLPDAPRRHLGDGTDMDTLADALAAALRYAFDPDRDDLTLPLDPTITNLRRTHLAMTNLRLRAQTIEDRANDLSRDQAKLIRVLRHQTRAEISGGAGSGKTYLALRKAQALTREGKSVALMCYSRGLGRFLQLVTSAWPEDDQPAYVGLFHDLPISWGAAAGSDDDSRYWEEDLPRRLRELADDRPRRELFDAIIIDEGQDFSPLWWEAVASCLRNQVEGTLYVFTDERQRVFGRQGSSPITMNPIQLDENLRNSQQIVTAFAGFATDPPISRNAPGEDIDVIPAPADDALAEADAAVEALMDSGWEPGDIALLTTGSRHPVQRETVEEEGYPAYWDEFFSAKYVFYGHVLGFKGLERPAVVLCLNGFRDETRAADMIYVGMSRATTKLVIVGETDRIETLRR